MTSCSELRMIGHWPTERKGCAKPFVNLTNANGLNQPFYDLQALDIQVLQEALPSAICLLGVGRFCSSRLGVKAPSPRFIYARPETLAGSSRQVLGDFECMSVMPQIGKSGCRCWRLCQGTQRQAKAGQIALDRQCFSYPASSSRAARMPTCHVLRSPLHSSPSLSD